MKLYYVTLQEKMREREHKRWQHKLVVMAESDVGAIAAARDADPHYFNNLHWCQVEEVGRDAVKLNMVKVPA